MIRPIGREQLQIDLFSLAKNQPRHDASLTQSPTYFEDQVYIIIDFFVKDVDLIFGEEKQ